MTIPISATLKSISILANDKGWEPSKQEVKSALVGMALQGLRTDWWFCQATNDRHLIFGDGAKDSEAMIAVRKRGGRYSFMTQREFAESRREKTNERSRK